MSRLVLLLALVGCPATPDEGPAPYNTGLTCDPTAAATMGDTPLRRLTRTQYENAVRDLFGVEGGYGELLDDDEYVGTFASNSVTLVSQVVVERYMTTAETIATDVDLNGLDDCNPYTSDTAVCAREFIERLAPRAYRRPLEPAELEAYVGLYELFQGDGHRDALRVVIAALLQSPYFLYHSDYEVSGEAADGELVPLDPYALASRLAFFLWNSIPDDALLEAAASGALSTTEGLTEQALRMLADPRSRAGLGDFALQWLGADHLDDVAKDPELFPDWTPERVRALQDETADFAAHVIREGDGTLSTLLSGDYTVLTPESAAHYGITLPDTWSPGDPISLEGTLRRGVLGHAGVLAAHSHYQRSSVTLRGKMIREDLLCQSLPDPPPDVDITLPEPTANQTTRDSVELHMSDPTCAGCHQLTDPIGFGLENFDAIGHYRELDNGNPVDATGELIGTDVDAAFTGPVELAALLRDSQAVELCATKQWFRYALGRMEEPRDACSVLDAYGSFEHSQSLRELILRLVTSDVFRSHRVDG